MVACRHQQQLKNIYKQITNTNKDINRALELLEVQGAPKAIRIRWVWFSGVGKVSRSVFGTLNEAAEEEIKGLIKGAEDKTRQMSDLLRKQTEVVYKEFGAIQMKTEELERKTQILDQHQQDSQKEAALILATKLFEENVLQYEIDLQTLPYSIYTARAHSPTVSKPYTDSRDSGFDIQNNLGSSFPSLNRWECHIGVSKDIRRDDPII